MIIGVRIQFQPNNITPIKSTSLSIDSYVRHWFVISSESSHGDDGERHQTQQVAPLDALPPNRVLIQQRVNSSSPFEVQPRQNPTSTRLSDDCQMVVHLL